MSKFKVGDKVRILKAEWANGDVSGWDTDEGYVGYISEPLDNEGDYGVALNNPNDDKGCFGYVGEDNLEPVEAEVSTKYQIGDRLIVTGDTARWGHHFDAGTVVTVTSVPPDGARGDMGYRVDSSEDYWWVAEVDLKPLEEPARTTVGTVTVDVQVRFMIGDVDVTDKLKSLVAEVSA